MDTDASKGSANNECIICLDKGKQLVFNKRCDCKYYYHVECWKNLYIQNKCVLCNKSYQEIIFIQNPIVIQTIERRQGEVFEEENLSTRLCLALFCLILCVIIVVGFLIGSK